LTFDNANANANAQFNVISGSGAVTLAAGAQSIVLNDNLIISQSSSSLLTWATPTRGGIGTDVKIIEHGGTGSGGVTISGVIANGDAGTGVVAVRQNNSNGTMTLSGANTYTGGTTVNAGTLALGTSNRLRDEGALTINGGTFDMGGFSDTVGAVTVNGGSLINSSTTGLTGSSYAVTGGTISAKLAGNGGLTKTGAGTTVLAGANTYTGGTFLNGGVLSVSSKANFASSTLTFDGGTLETTASFDLTSANATTLNAGGGTIRIGAGLTSNTGAAPISGTGGLTKEGDGVLTLGSLATTYTGGTTVNAGTLALSNNNRLSDTGALTINGGTFDMGGFSDTVGAVTVNGGSLINSSTTGLTGSSYAVTGGTISAKLAGNGGLTKTGAGQLNLTALTNSYKGPTSVQEGTLALYGSLSGSLDFSNGTSLILRTTNPAPSSVGGSITFPSNCVLNLENTNGLTGAGPFTLITAATSISGSPYLASSLTNYVLTNTGRALILSLAGSTPASGYATYLSSIGMPANTAFNANVNGATIGLVYAFGSSNGSPQNNGITAVPVVIGDQLTYTFDVKNDSNLSVTYETSIDLVTWTTPQPVSAGTGSTPAGFLKKQVQVIGSGKLFVRINVTHP
jgi:autotransporter-associated beta strand protein